MKVIFLQNVAKIGQRGEVKNVADGYALNFLIPNKLAEAATDLKINQMQLEKDKQGKKEEKKREENQGLIKKLKGVKLEIKAKVADSGKLFAGIGEKDIVGELKKQKKIEMENKFIKMEKHIKEIGEYEIKVNLGNNLEEALKVKVIAK